jgi:hypothetical protein
MGENHTTPSAAPTPWPDAMQRIGRSPARDSVADEVV